MITVSSNLSSVTQRLISKFKTMNEQVNDKLVRNIAFGMHDLVKHRVHTEGKKADGSAIGTYRNPYLKLREKKYGRLEGTKMVFSLTRNMENQFAVIATDRGYGLGWLDELNPKKAEGLQYGNKTLKGFGLVYALTKEEKQAIQPIVNEFIKEHLK